MYWRGGGEFAPGRFISLLGAVSDVYMKLSCSAYILLKILLSAESEPLFENHCKIMYSVH